MTLSNFRFQLRHDTAANWTANDPILALGEPGIETDTGQWKIGDGALAWTALAYMSGGGGGSGDMILASVQTVTGKKQFGTIGGAVGKLALAGSTSGSTILNAAAVAGAGTVVLPTTGTLATLAGTETLTNKTLTSPVVNTPTGIVKGDVGLGSVDNVADASKPVSTAQAAADSAVAAAAASDATTKANAALASALAADAFAFGTIAVSGQSNVVADSTNDTLTLIAGTNVTITTVAGTDTITINSTASGTGDVVGPASATDNAIARFDATTGKLIQNSAATVADTTGDIVAGKYNTVAISGSSTPTLAVTGTTTVSGANTGDQTSVTGNAGTATALATARNINGTAFDGTSNITVTAAAGTLTGATLAAGVTASSLTSVGTIATGVWNGTDIAVPDGGTGVGTFTDGGVLIGNATGALQVTTAGTAGEVLTSNGAGVDPTFQAATGGVSGANPSASVGLSAVNGAATTYLRSDGAPALSQAIAPTWTGVHIFDKDGAASTSAVLFTGDVFTGGSGTTTVPLVVIQPGGVGAVSTYSTSGTQLAFNSASGFAGNFIDAHVNGAASVFTLSSTGDIVGGKHNGLTITTTTGTLTVASGKTVTVSNTLTFTGTDSSSVAFGAGGTVVYLADSPTWTGAHVFSKNGALSLPTLDISGSAITGGSGTTTTPLLRIEPAGTTDATTWSTSGTYLGINGASSFVGNAIDYKKDNAARFSVDFNGAITCNGNINAGNFVIAAAGVEAGATSYLGWTTRSAIKAPSNGVITLLNNAFNGFTSLNLGPDQATPVNVSLLAGSGVGADKTGGNLNIQAGLSTGAGVGGVITFKTSPSTASSSTANTATTALAIDQNGLISASFPIRLKGYTVATLPAAGTAGRTAYVTDALTPTYLVAIVGGGAVVTPVFDNGTNWVSY